MTFDTRLSETRHTACLCSSMKRILNHVRGIVRLSSATTCRWAHHVLRRCGWRPPAPDGSTAGIPSSSPGGGADSLQCLNRPSSAQVDHVDTGQRRQVFWTVNTYQQTVYCNLDFCMGLYIIKNVRGVYVWTYSALHPL